MLITISNNISLPLDQISPDLAEAIKSALEFRNPEYWRAMGRLKSLGKANAIPREANGKPMQMIIRGWHEDRGRLILPRGVASELITFLDTQGQEYHIEDKSRSMPPVEFKFLKKLRPYQQEAMDAVLKRRLTTLVCPTGGGKTTMGIYSITARRQPACIIVHTNKLVRQWAERIAGSTDHEPQLDVTHDEIGYITEGKVRIGTRVTIALIQTLVRKPEALKHFGHLVFDEAHHLPANSFASVAGAADSRYCLAITATPKRSDGKEPLIFWGAGPVVHQVSYSRLVREGWILLPEPVIHQTGFRTGLECFNVSTIGMEDQDRHKVNRERDKTKSTLLTELIKDQERNRQICTDIADVLVAGGGPCLVLSERTDHCDELGSILNSMGLPASVSHGKLKRRDQNKAEMALRHGEAQVLVATGALLGEGFDEAVPSDLFIVTPVSFSEKLKQWLGRIGRPAEDKAARVHDYHDVECEPLMRSARERLRIYKSLAKLAQGPTPKRK